MKRIRTVTDWLLYSNNGKHQGLVDNTIYGKIIYPVAINPLDEERRSYYMFSQGNKYEMVR